MSQDPTDSEKADHYGSSHEALKEDGIAEAIADALKVLAPGLKNRDLLAPRFALMLRKRGLTINRVCSEPPDEHPAQHEGTSVLIGRVPKPGELDWLDARRPTPPVQEEKGEAPRHVTIIYDGFSGDVIGSYITREGKRGIVVQQDGTRVVHVYREDRAEPSPSTPAPETDIGKLVALCPHGFPYNKRCDKCANLAKRLRESAYCEPRCEGRCLECPAEVAREAATRLEQMSQALEPFARDGCIPLAYGGRSC